MVPIIAISLTQILKTSTESTSSSSLSSISSVDNELKLDLMKRPNYCQSETDLNSTTSSSSKTYNVFQLDTSCYHHEHRDGKGTVKKSSLTTTLSTNEESMSRGEEDEQRLRYVLLENKTPQQFDAKTLELEPRVRALDSTQSLNMDGDYDDRLKDFRESDRSISKASFSSDSGISTMYTSTPKKRASQELSKSIDTTSHLESPPGLSLVKTSPKTVSSYDHSLAQILESGDEEFRSKYSSWKKMQSLDQEKEDQIQEAARKNKEKLLNLESRAEKYRNLMEIVSRENRKLKATVEAVVEETSKVTEQTKINLQAELDQHINDIRAEWENQKLQLQQQHAQQLKIFLDQSCSQIEKVENEYHAQIVSLNHLVENLKFQNEDLQEQLKQQKRINEAPYALRPPQTSGSYCFQKEKEHLLSIIQELKNKLYAVEKDKLALSTSYREKVEMLNSALTSLEKNYRVKLEDSHKDFQLLQVEKDKEMQLLKSQLVRQSQESQNVINGLRNNYGSKIQSLSDMVEKLQIDIDEQNEKDAQSLR